MTAAVAAPPLPVLHAEDNQTETTSASAARKRRREILLHQRAAGTSSSAATPDPTPAPQSTPAASSVCPSVSPAAVQIVEQDAPLPVKKRRVEEGSSLGAATSSPRPATSAATPVHVENFAAKTIISTKTPNEASGGKKTVTSKAKKPQMRYDPDVPMSKEATAAWRREQRRKRNRESAAASRQRQRDRIAELEVEVDDWKTKFAEVMTRLNAMEKARGMAPSSDADVEDKAMVKSQSTASPNLSPQLSSNCSSAHPLDSQAQAVRASCGSDLEDGMVARGKPRQQQQQKQQGRQLNETISRPA